MKAMILAAGLGTRLGKLTENKPKALVDFAGKPMLQLLLLKLKVQGFRQILINIHHFGSQIVEFVERHKGFGLDVSFSNESEKLFDTGGAIWNARNFFQTNEPVLVHNVDVFSDINLQKVLEQHIENGALASLLVHNRQTKRYLLFDRNYQLKGWTNTTENNYKWVDKPCKVVQRLAYSGIWIAGSGFVEKLPFSGTFSIINAWLAMAKTENIYGLQDHSTHWFDIGSAEKIKAAENKVYRLLNS